MREDNENLFHHWPGDGLKETGNAPGSLSIHGMLVFGLMTTIWMMIQSQNDAVEYKNLAMVII